MRTPWYLITQLSWPMCTLNTLTESQIWFTNWGNDGLILPNSKGYHVSLYSSRIFFLSGIEKDKNTASHAIKKLITTSSTMSEILREQFYFLTVSQSAEHWRLLSKMRNKYLLTENFISTGTHHETYFFLLAFVLQYIGSLDVPRPNSRMEIVAAMRRIRVSSHPCCWV